MAEIEDPRMDYIKNTTLKLLNVNDGLWAELIWKEENQAVIKDFLDTPSVIFLLIFINENETLSLALEIPTLRYSPRIIAYFSKSTPVVSSENYKGQMMFGCISGLRLNDYKNLFEEVLYPVLSNPLNNSRWPADITNEIILHFEDFQKTLAYHVGLAQGKTSLFIPEAAKQIENFNVDEIPSKNVDWKLKDTISSISKMVCEWRAIIKEILEITSEDILSKVKQGPITEISFWNNRQVHLEFIQKQLDDPIIEKMLFALEKYENAHYMMFKKLLQDVLEALFEAQEIHKSLSAMSDKLEKLKICDFSKLKEDLPEAMKVITVSWNNSEYFKRVPSRIAVLIKKVCFFLMEKVEDYLNPAELFKSNEYEMKNKVKICIEACNSFLQSYTDCRENFSDEEKTYPWEFPDERVFDLFNNFIDRLNKIYEIFEISELYCSIPQYKILGIQQIPYKMRLDKLSSSFKTYYQTFTDSTYNSLSMASEEFMKDFKTFSQKIDELDSKLGATLSQACLSCNNTEDSLKLMNSIQDLLKRPSINQEFKKVSTSLLRNIYFELLAAKENYDKLLIILDSKDLVIYKNLPTVSGELQWSMDLQRKLSFPVDSLQQIQNNDINVDDETFIVRAYEEMNALLQRFQSEIFKKWEITLDIIKEQMNQSLFRSEENVIILNFSPQVMDIAQEIQHVKIMKKSDLLPAEAIKLHENLKQILLAYSFLACTTRWYNDLAKNLMDFEKSLINDDWTKVSKDLEKGSEETWMKSDIVEYSEQVYNTTKSLYERMMKARENVKEVQEFIETWNKTPVFVRDTHDNLLQVIIASSMWTQIYHVIETSCSMNRVMEENLLLFECDPESTEWKNYVLYLDSIIENGLKDSILCSLQYLLENTNELNKKLAKVYKEDSKNIQALFHNYFRSQEFFAETSIFTVVGLAYTQEPFYKIRMILEEDIKFIPSLSKNQQGNLLRLFEIVIDGIYSPAMKIKRLTNSEKDYSDSIVEDETFTSLKNQIFQNIESGINNTLVQLINFQQYSDLWLQDIDTVLKDFVLYGPLPETKGDEKEIEVADTLLEVKPPTEEEFRHQIAQFDKLKKKIEEISPEILVESWLLLDITSFKKSLSLLIREWSTAYKKKLADLKSQGKLRKIEDDGD